MIFIMAVALITDGAVVLSTSSSQVTYFMQGHATIDMDSIYNNNGAPIPVTIIATGPKTNLTMVLYNSSDKLNPLESITLGAVHSERVTSGKFLSGNTFDNGRYNIFINRTSLDTGYYELVGFRYMSPFGKGFYLINESER